MLSILEDVVVVILTLAISLLLIFFLNRLWALDKRRAHNDLIGWQLTVLGTTYAVIIGFMLYTVWTNFGFAQANADAEANSLVNVYRLARGLPSAQRAELQHWALAYADAVLTREWPAMARGDQNFSAIAENRQMWQTLMSVRAASPTEITAEDHAISELSEVNEHRRMRQVASAERLPGILWWVLLVGGAVTIVSACLFGANNTGLHALQVSFFTLLIALVLVAIADIDRPFQGAVHVSDGAFLRARETMRTE